MDPTLQAIVEELREHYLCHTIILYGSRARGLTTATSDYDVIGVKKRGKASRIAKKMNGVYWDVLVYPEKDLRKFGDRQFTWKNARLIFGRGSYGKKLIQRINKYLKLPYRKQPQYEIDVMRVWAEKQLERCRQKDIPGAYRRAEFQYSLIEHYFFMRQMRFQGPKEGFSWLKNNDPRTFRSIARALQHPSNLTHLEVAARLVYQIK